MLYSVSQSQSLNWEQEDCRYSLQIHFVTIRKPYLYFQQLLKLGCQTVTGTHFVTSK